MKINEKTRSRLNKVCARYSHIMELKDFKSIYDELDEFGVTIPAWDYYSEGRPHPFEINGEQVENSYFILSKYYMDLDTNRIDFNCYFS